MNFAKYLGLGLVGLVTLACGAQDDGSFVGADYSEEVASTESATITFHADIPIMDFGKSAKLVLKTAPTLNPTVRIYYQPASLDDNHNVPDPVLIQTATISDHEFFIHQINFAHAAWQGRSYGRIHVETGNVATSITTTLVIDGNQQELEVIRSETIQSATPWRSMVGDFVKSWDSVEYRMALSNAGATACTGDFVTYNHPTISGRVVLGSFYVAPFGSRYYSLKSTDDTRVKEIRDITTEFDYANSVAYKKCFVSMARMVNNRVKDFKVNALN